MGVYKRGEFWWYSFGFKGQRIQCGTKQKSKRIALQMEAIHKAALAKEGYGLVAEKPTEEKNPRQEAPTFADFADRYLVFSKNNKQCHGMDFYYIKRTLEPFFGSLRLDQITSLKVEDFKDRRLKDGLKKSSINRELGLLKSMLNWAVKQQLVDKNGAKEARLFKLDDPLPDRVLSGEEEAKLLAACDEPELRYRAPHLKSVILVALYTGLRRGEILRLRWADLDFDDSVLTVWKSKTKSGRGRRVNLNSLLKATLLALRQVATAEWVFSSPARFQKADEPHRHLVDVKNAFHRAIKIAGIAPITFHQLRHTFCSRLADAGVPLPVIQDLAGHASITMTRRYTHPGNELKQKAVELLLATQNPTEPTTKPATPVTERAAAEPKPEGQVIAFRRIKSSRGEAAGD